MAKIGIMGGTFDPIHNIHLMLGKQAFQEYHLDAVWYMPSKCPPHKAGHVITSTRDRCEMVQMAIRPHPFMVFSDFELLREGKTYTADTLRLLHTAYPEHEFYFIIGADSLFDIEMWYHPEMVLTQAVFLVAGRRGLNGEDTKHVAFPLEEELDAQIRYLSEKYHTSIFKLHCPDTDTSSTKIREMVACGDSIRHMVPAEVAAYIEKNFLYQRVFE